MTALSPAEYANDFESFRRDIDPDCNISESDFYAMETHEVEEIAQMIIDGQ